MNLIKITLRKTKSFFNQPQLLLLKPLYFISPLLKDKLYLKVLFFLHFGYPLNLKEVKTFNQKLNWLKLYNRKPEYTRMVDKEEAKNVASGIIGRDYIIETLGIWEKFEDINFDSLPEKFVLKTTHDSGGVVLCRDKENFNYRKARAIIDKHLKRNLFYTYREWPYKNVKPRIIAERYLDCLANELVDYKFFCFHGEPHYMYITSNREKNHVFYDYYDMDFQHLDITVHNGQGDKDHKKPFNFELMKMLCRKLSKGIPHVRIDFYELNNKVYFGEYTFFSEGGVLPLKPKKWEFIWGDLIHIDKNLI